MPASSTPQQEPIALATRLACIHRFMADGDTSPHQSASTSRSGRSRDVAPRDRILIVDDDADLREALVDLLDLEERFEVVAVGTLEEARAAIATNPPAAALIDIKLDRDNGIDLIPELKASEHDITAIVMTAYHTADHAVQALRSGADDFLYKPLDTANLLNTLDRSLAARRLRAEHRAMERRFRAVFEQSFQLLFMLSEDGTVLEANRTALDFGPVAADALLGQPFWQAPWWRESPELAAQVREQVERARHGERVQFEIAMDSPEHGPTVLELAINVIKGDGRDVELLVPEARDITARKAAEAQLRIAAKVFENAAEGIVIADAEGRIVETNNEFAAMTGYTREDLLGRTLTLVIPRLLDRSVRDEVMEGLRLDARWRGEVAIQHRDGTQRMARLSVSAERHDDGSTETFIALASDLSELKAAQQRLEFQANHDALTGLPNRTLFRDRLDQVLRRGRRRGSSTALLFIDIDRFKHVNDTLGHHTGDLLLVEVARRLSDVVRDEDTLARLAGDEFVILIDECDGTECAEDVARRALARIGESFDVNGNAGFVSASIGIAIHPRDAGSAEALLSRADTAMFFAKRSGRSSYRLFDISMQEHAEERMRLEQQLSGAVVRGELFIQYQPKWSLDSLRVVGAEALVRWRHDTLGVVSPSRFIPVAEDMGLIGAIGDEVLRAACGAVKRWQREGQVALPVSVNIAPRQLMDAGFVDRVRSLLEEFGIPADMLELEVTEGSIMQDVSRAVTVLEELRTLGVRVAIDDFGTGYSSLNQLRHLPVDTVKIDRSFLDQLESDESDRVIVQSIISLANSLGLRVVAEGVETKGQLALLREQGCHEAQGFLLAHPLFESDFNSLIDSPS